jgi:hypothetical protein
VRALRLVSGLLILGGWVVAGAVPASAAVSVAVVPMKGPPGAPVSMQVSTCPTGTTDSVAARFRPAAATPPPFDPSDSSLAVVAVDSAGGAELDLRIPIDAAPGQYAFDAFCVSEGGGVVDGPVTVPFEVANMQLNVSPRDVAGGDTVSVSGSGCPTGTTDQVFIRTHGASDDVAPFDPADANQVGVPVASDGSFSTTLTVPADAPAGENAVEAFCISEGGSPLAGPAFGVFIVGELAVTGNATFVLSGIGLAMLALGGLFVLTNRPNTSPGVDSP